MQTRLWRRMLKDSGPHGSTEAMKDATSKFNMLSPGMCVFKNFPKVSHWKCMDISLFSPLCFGVGMKWWGSALLGPVSNVPIQKAAIISQIPKRLSTLRQGRQWDIRHWYIWVFPLKPPLFWGDSPRRKKINDLVIKIRLMMADFVYLVHYPSRLQW